MLKIIPPSSPDSEHARLNNCPNCEDGWTVEPGKGARRCDCLRQKIKQRALDRIPTIYRNHRLATIQPDAQRHARQLKLIPFMRANPELSYALYGTNGSGKSLLGWLLYREAVESGRFAVGMPLADLLEQFRRWELHSDDLPAVTPGDLRQSKRRYTLFFDEIEKCRPSEYASEMLFRLVDAAYSFNHQLIITSNFQPKELSAHWATNGGSYGPSIIRRITEIQDGIEEKMF